MSLYEKLYKEALSRAKEKRDEYKRLDGEKSFVPSDIEYIFPELKESEDERIRKEIINCVKNYGPATANSKLYKDMLTWLEKQGGKDKLIKELSKYKVKYTQEVLSQQLEKQCETFTKKDVDDAYLKGISDAKNELEKQGEKLPVGFYYVNSEGKKFYSDTFKCGDVILHVEKQGEQKETLCDKCKREQPSHSCQDIMELGRCAIEHEQKYTDKAEPKFKVGERK